MSLASPWRLLPEESRTLVTTELLSSQGDSLTREPARVRQGPEFAQKVAHLSGSEVFGLDPRRIHSGFVALAPSWVARAQIRQL